MKYNYLSLCNILKSKLIKYFLVMVFSFIVNIFFQLTGLNFITNEILYNSLGISVLSKGYILDCFFTIILLLFIILLFYYSYTFELDNYTEEFFLREKMINWYKNRTLLLFLLLIVFKSLIYISLCIILKIKNISFVIPLTIFIKDILICFILQLLISLNVMNKNKLNVFICIAYVCFILFYDWKNLNIFVFLIMSLILLIINCYCIKIKKYILE